MIVLSRQIADLAGKIEHAKATGALNSECIDEIDAALVELGGLAAAQDEVIAEQEDALIELAGLIGEEN